MIRTGRADLDFDDIRTEFGLPSSFPAAVLAEASADRACKRSKSARPKPDRPIAPACKKLRRELGPGHCKKVRIRQDSRKERQKVRSSQLRAFGCQLVI